MAQAGLGSHRALRGRPGGDDAQLQSLHGRHAQVHAYLRDQETEHSDTRKFKLLRVQA